MILYNVTVKISREKHVEWLNWMRDSHIPEVMQTGHFVDQKLCRLLHEEEDGVTYSCQYFADSMEDFESYQAGPARKLQEDHQERFGDHYVAFRSLMEVLP